MKAVSFMMKMIGLFSVGFLIILLLWQIGFISEALFVGLTVIWIFYGIWHIIMSSGLDDLYE